MTDTVAAAILSSVITSGFAVIGILVQRVHRTVNSRMTEMLAIVKAAAHAEGMKDEKERDRTP